MFEAVPDAVVIVDGGGTIVLANAQCRVVFGHDPERLRGLPIETLVPERFRSGHPDRRSGFLADPNPRPMGLLQLVAVRSDGSEFPAEISLAAIDADGTQYVSATVRDITERLRAEAETHRLQDELVATVSHELRTPLAAIIGYAELMSDLDEVDLSRRARKLLGVIERNAARELQLVDDLLTLAFLDDDRLRINRSPVDLFTVAERVVTDHVLRARERGIELVLVDDRVRPVMGDFYRLVQAAENLLSNALKFTRPGGRIDVAVRDHATMGMLEVRDTGIGVSPEERAKVFDRLYRAPSAIESHTRGAGLGLSIVRAIVEAHGGWVDVDSEVGVGTVVRLAVPYAT